MKLQMFKNCKIDNVKNVSFFSTIEAQNDYYEDLITAGNGFEKDINFNKLGEPFIINYEYGDILEYNYGRFKLSDKWYYFSVEDLEVNTNGKTKIIYQIDAWETSRLQFGVSLGVGTIYRGQPNNCPIQREADFQPITYKFTKAGGSRSYNNVITIVHNSTTDKDNINVFDSYIFMEIAHTGQLAKYLAYDENNGNPFKPSDLMGAWITPFKPTGATTPAGSGWELKSDPSNEIIFYRWLFDPIFMIGGIKTSFYTKRELKTTDTERGYITDFRGNELYTVPFGKVIPNNTTINGIFDITYTSCNIVLNSDSDPDLKFTLPCEPLSVIFDSKAEYFARFRQSDIDNRQLVRERQLAESVMNIGQSAIGGGIAGGMAGMVGAGAVGGTVLGVASSLGQYALSGHYNQKEQQIIDARVKNTKDELGLIGEAVDSVREPWYVTEEWDDLSKNRLIEHQNTYGNKLNYSSINCQNFYTVGPMVGDFEIKGNIPNTWKNQINSRFRNGVRVIE